jgi:RNA polymerase sigma-70 factor (ECF subfamily)
MAPDDPLTEQLLARTQAGEAEALQQLFARHRKRLRKMVALRLDPRLAARVDPSDVVQDALIDASRKLAEYLSRRPIDFYPWLRQIACERLIDLHRRHVRAARRSVRREEPQGFWLNKDSALQLASRFAASAHPSRPVIQAELCQRVQAALDQLPPQDREVLVLRYVEQLVTSEIAAVLGVTEGAVKGRHRRAVERMAALMNHRSMEAP